MVSVCFCGIVKSEPLHGVSIVVSIVGRTSPVLSATVPKTLQQITVSMNGPVRPFDTALSIYMFDHVSFRSNIHLSYHMLITT